MIPVTRQAEPATFDENVRAPGTAAMRNHQGDWTSNAFWNFHNYWAACLDEMYTLYGETCAYICVHMVRRSVLGIKGASVEHFIPVKDNRNLAYEWDNYRLVCGAANSLRGNLTPFLDPFALSQHFFELLLNSGNIIAPHADPNNQAVRNTLSVVNNPIFTKYRAELFARYKAQPVVLKRESLFIYQEAVRQGKIQRLPD